MGTEGEEDEEGGNIKFEINNEESIVNFLTKDHKANMSLLFYDFNNANQRIIAKKVAHPNGKNLADDVIPEDEAGETIDLVPQA